MNKHKNVTGVRTQSKKKFRSSLIRNAILAGISTLTCSTAFAAETYQNLDDANAEIARLRAQLQAAGQSISGAATPVTTTQATPVQAKKKATDVDEILIKAQGLTKSPLEKLQDTPISISVVAGVELEKQNIINF